jgi:hypothetical protein
MHHQPILDSAEPPDSTLACRAAVLIAPFVVGEVALVEAPFSSRIRCDWFGDERRYIRLLTLEDLSLLK